jgi:predicted glycoside hydrolase/deacetylase ChbG (UPF0249 family)
VKRLIVNADDFGLTRGVNRAILECHQRGIVTSTTLMANSDEFEDAVASAKRLAAPILRRSCTGWGGSDPALGIGCHVVLADGRPVLPPSEVPSLLEPGTGLFYRSIQQLAKQALGHRFRAEEIEAEATAQFQKIQAAGIRISHFDAHKHAHIFPSILKPLLRAAAVCGVPALRNPFEPVFSMPIPNLLRLPVRYLEVLALRAFRAKFHSMVAESGLRTTDGSLGLVATGTLNVSNLSALVERMQDGLWELVSRLQRCPARRDRHTVAGVARNRDAGANRRPHPRGTGAQWHTVDFIPATERRYSSGCYSERLNGAKVRAAGNYPLTVGTHSVMFLPESR